MRVCRSERLDALDPSQRVKFEAGMTKYYEESNEMLRCAGVSIKLYTMEPRGFLLPTYHNAPCLHFINKITKTTVLVISKYIYIC
jgi:Cupin